MTPTEIILVMALGLGAGLVGGLAGIGGSIVVLPGLHFVLSRAEVDPEIHHTFMAAAMATNLFVSAPSALSHHRAGAVRVPLLKRLAISASIGIAIGVLLSNVIPAGALKFLLGVVVVWYALRNLMRVIRPRRRAFGGTGRVERVTTPKLTAIGLTVGIFSGVLGIGGGTLLVPLLQAVCNLKLRNAIATSSALICITAGVGAVIKLATLGTQDQSALEAIKIAGLLIPPAMVGGWFGAKLTHTLPLQLVRVLLIVLLTAIAARMMGLWGTPPASPAITEPELFEPVPAP